MFVTPSFAQEATEDAATSEPEALHTETGVDDHGATAEGSFPPFDSSTFASQILWLAITFGLFYLFMQKVVVPRIGSILENRRDRIASDFDEADRLKTEADEAIAAYEQELAEAKTKANQIAQKARDDAKAEADIERTQVESDLAAKLSQAEARIAEIKAQALGEVDTIAEDTTAAIVEQLIGEPVSKSTASSAVKAAAAGEK
ncbi:F0F1 ATP synthase subunit B [Pararhizobium haloflavum]|uniref:F0F1 ATP synthase subunit B n=1 Tax=Pararhizobium haloflavum TaxID=2037914 RepID=UPI000C17B0B4|nr:F0F1 ATP synthase subunit B [Pararhizobium haloflavum]